MRMTEQHFVNTILIFLKFKMSSFNSSTSFPYAAEAELEISIKELEVEETI